MNIDRRTAIRSTMKAKAVNDFKLSRRQLSSPPKVGAVHADSVAGRSNVWWEVTDEGLLSIKDLSSSAE